MSTTLLEIKDLHVHYKVFEGKLKVLDGVNFYIKPGERVGLIGEMGCGKTTTMKAILRILPMQRAVITKGEILFEGKDILKMNSSSMSELRKKNISMIFQDATAALNPVFSVGSQTYDVIKYSNINENNDKEEQKKEIRNKQIQALKDVLLPDPERILTNYPIQLSGGMRQRVCIALALLNNKDLLIADEPTTSLDVTISAQILKLIGDLIKKRGMANILISHALGNVNDMTDRLYIMYAGSMIETGSTKCLFSNPLHPYSKGLISAVPRLTGTGIGEGIAGHIPDYINPPVGCRFHPRCSYALEICKVKKPSLVKVESNHEVACFLYQNRGD